MAKKISQLTQATQVKSDDVTVIVQDGETKKLPLNTLVTKQDIENKKVAGLAKLDEIEATYENDTYTPTIAVKNKSSVKVGEGDGVDYSANVMDGHVKSAILSGNTLVNLMTKCKDEYVVRYHDINNPNNTVANISMMKPNTEYTLFYKAKYRTEGDGSGIGGSLKIATSIEQGFFGTGQKYTTEYMKYVYKFTTSSVVDCFVFASNGKFFAIKECVLLEGDHTNVDIPFFEGMQSVKMPVLTTTGKNLFDGKLKNGNIQSDSGLTYELAHMRITDFIKINANKTITISKLNNNDIDFRIEKVAYYDINKNFIGVNGEVFMFPKTLTPPMGAAYIRAVFCKGNWDTTATEEDFATLQVQIEEGSVATSYEPYKSNILTVNEPVELRGIGDVQDTLNCLTGEVVERIGEIVLDGNEESWMIANDSSKTNVVFYSTTTKQISKKGGFYKIISDKFSWPSEDLAQSSAPSIEGCYIANDGNICISIDKSKLNNLTVDGFREWLSQNPTTVQYHLETESIKTVDLIPSGTHPSTTPYCWKDGHIQLSSSGLLPSLEYSVVTSRAGQISQNAAMIVKNDKRIFDLEILLAGGLVNTTYQALTLQNQVETGLSKVSLSSETEPDYLLYHMIMKLIEEKAYKLDDLTEKVSVFYLYEKLSDEQFETIYSALYPFVEDEYFESDIPGDDEVIEEPIVDESLEEVEDEVVM